VEQHLPIQRFALTLQTHSCIASQHFHKVRYGEVASNTCLFSRIRLQKTLLLYGPAFNMHQQSTANFISMTGCYRACKCYLPECRCPTGLSIISLGTTLLCLIFSSHSPGLYSPSSCIIDARIRRLRLGLPLSFKSAHTATMSVLLRFDLCENLNSFYFYKPKLLVLVRQVHELRY
jgi:hypothetical protein